MSISKRVEDARRAFEKRDLESSAKAHDLRRIRAEHREKHGGVGHQYIGEMVYGGLDGIITTFAVVSGVAGADLGAHVILIMGLANLFADGFSMATGAFLSSRSEQEYYNRELERERWEVEHFPEAERAELKEIYLARGYSEENAERLVEAHTSSPERWVQAMMIDELGLLPDERKPLISALATFVSFVVAGSMPLLIYLIGLITPIPPDIAFLISLVLSGAALFGLGAAKVFVTGLKPLRSGLEMLVVGGLAAAVAYAVGALLKNVGG